MEKTDKLKIADFMKENGQYVELKRKSKFKLIREKIPSQKVQLKIKKIEKIIIQVLIAGAVVGALCLEQNRWANRMEKLSSEKQIVIHIEDNVKEAPKKITVEEDEDLSYLYESPETIEKENYENNDFMERIGNEENKISLDNKSNKIGNISNNYNDVLKNLTDEQDRVFKENAYTYGLDSNMLAAIGQIETSLGTGSFSKTARGIMQIENVNFENIYTNVYNYRTNTKETVDFKELNLNNLHDNVKASCVMLQELVTKYDYNLLFAIQAYNFGPTAVNKALKEASIETGKQIKDLDIEEVIPFFKKNKSGDSNYVYKYLQYIKERITGIKITKNNIEYIYIYDLGMENGKGKPVKIYSNDNLEKGVFYDISDNTIATEDDIYLAINTLNERLKENNKTY